MVTISTKAQARVFGISIEAGCNCAFTNRNLNAQADNTDHNGSITGIEFLRSERRYWPNLRALNDVVGLIVQIVMNVGRFTPSSSPPPLPRKLGHA